MRTKLTIAGLGAVATGALVVAGMTIAASPKQGPIFAKLDGKSEIGATGKKNAGDKDGAGSFSATISGNKLCYGLSVDKIGDPQAAHIHRGSKSKNGPILITLDPPDDGNPGASGECVTASSNLLQRIRKNPNKYYVNVHNSAFPDGAVRGQLFKQK